MSAARRVTRSSIDWKRLRQIMPERDSANYNNLLGKSSQYVSRVASLPEQLPKIDFNAYRQQLTNKSAIDNLEKGYTSFQVPYPNDVENVLEKLNQLQKQSEVEMKAFLEKLQQKIDAVGAERVKLTSLPPLEEMTLELEAYYYPEKVKEALFDFDPADDPHRKMLEEQKKAKQLGQKGHH